MSHRGVHLARAAAALVLITSAFSISFQVAEATPVPPGTGSEIVSVSGPYDPCGSNRYGCYAPYGACDTYQPGCAGPNDSGYKPYDYDQNRQNYGGYR